MRELRPWIKVMYNSPHHELELSTVSWEKSEMVVRLTRQVERGRGIRGRLCIEGKECE